MLRLVEDASANKRVLKLLLLALRREVVVVVKMRSSSSSVSEFISSGIEGGGSGREVYGSGS